MKQKTFNVIISILVVILYAILLTKSFTSKNEIRVLEIPVRYTEPIQEPTFKDKSPEEGLKEALAYYGIKCPNIVYAQAVLETGHFKSNVCQGKNNLFGLYDSSNKKYYEFSHWSESVLAYKNYIQSKYKSDSSYYKFLQSINYAEDPTYIKKVKRLVNNKSK